MDRSSDVSRDVKVLLTHSDGLTDWALWSYTCRRNVRQKKKKIVRASEDGTAETKKAKMVFLTTSWSRAKQLVPRKKCSRERRGLDASVT